MQPEHSPADWHRLAGAPKQEVRPVDRVPGREHSVEQAARIVHASFRAVPKTSIVSKKQRHHRLSLGNWWPGGAREASCCLRLPSWRRHRDKIRDPASVLPSRRRPGHEPMQPAVLDTGRLLCRATSARRTWSGNWEGKVVSATGGGARWSGQWWEGERGGVHRNSQWPHRRESRNRQQ